MIRTTAAPTPVRGVTELLPTAWRRRAAEHAARADLLTVGRRERRAAGAAHPIDDFLYDYYGTRPSALRRWHPGAGVVLLPGAAGPRGDTRPSGSSDHGDQGQHGQHGQHRERAEHAAWRWYTVADDAVRLDVAAFLADRGDAVRYMRDLLRSTASRPAQTGCLGLHEWAMVYRQDDTRRRHTLPLRLGRDGTDAVVEAHQIRCTHFDAFRFFTPEALGRNRLQPTRATQPQTEQPGCLHANMDCLKWALKLGPAVPGDLLLDCFELARDIRVLDMQASPYDVSSLGEPAVAIETVDGRAEYVARQRAFAERTAPVRARLLEVCETLLSAA